jgi:hypothetical protein
MDYSKRVSLLIEKANSCLPDGQALREQEIFNYFVNGLSQENVTKVINNGKKNVKEIVEFLKDIEDLITQFSSLNLKPRDEKFCKLHGNCNHTSRECFSIKRDEFKRTNSEFKRDENRERHSINKSNTNYLQESNNMNESVKVNIEFNKIKLKTLIDTGSQKNLISISDLKPQDIDIKTLVNPHKITVANNTQ